eukprot:4495140-Lingulodinium_polyedra.AAC.1
MGRGVRFGEAALPGPSRPRSLVDACAGVAPPGARRPSGAIAGSGAGCACGGRPLGPRGATGLRTSAA